MLKVPVFKGKRLSMSYLLIYGAMEMFRELPEAIKIEENIKYYEEISY